MTQAVVASRHRDRGFTLIEALAALVLIGLVLPVAMRAVTLSTHVASQSLQRTRAAALADSKLAELIATGKWQETSLEGDFTEEASGAVAGLTTAAGEEPVKYTWAATTKDWLDDRVQQLDVTVRWEAGGAKQELTLSTLVRVEEP